MRLQGFRVSAREEPTWLRRTCGRSQTVGIPGSQLGFRV